jgi:hypothetical protein
VTAVAVAEVSVDELIISPCDDHDGFVHEHLRRYCSKFRPLPAIAVTPAGDRLRVVAGQRYAVIARELGEARIRAVMTGDTFEAARRRGVRGVVALVPADVLERELQAMPASWHVFFFAAGLDPWALAQVEARFAEFVTRSLPDVSTLASGYDAAGPCFEIQFPTPVTDYEWAARYRAFIVSLNDGVAKIATYQGRRFELIAL